MRPSRRALSGAVDDHDHLIALHPDGQRLQVAGFAAESDELPRPARDSPPSETADPVQILPGTDVEAGVVPRALDDSIGVFQPTGSACEGQAQVRAAVQGDAHLITHPGNDQGVAVDIDRDKVSVRKFVQATHCDFGVHLTSSDTWTQPDHNAHLDPARLDEEGGGPSPVRRPQFVGG